MSPLPAQSEHPFSFKPRRVLALVPIKEDPALVGRNTQHLKARRNIPAGRMPPGTSRPSENSMPSTHE